ncbi:unnamed protein product [Linum trigynum]|uniref:Uncharacterized protein n=1 Tax=Linum trigynum TaxID=586398 RepID=A0AAV2FTS9_9ROSI
MQEETRRTLHWIPRPLPTSPAVENNEDTPLVVPFSTEDIDPASVATSGGATPSAGVNPASSIEHGSSSSPARRTEPTPMSLIELTSPSSPDHLMESGSSPSSTSSPVAQPSPSVDSEAPASTPGSSPP